MKLTKDDLCLVARTKGWKGGNPTKQGMLDWLQARGITMEEVARTVQQMRNAASGQATGTLAAPTVTTEQIRAIVRTEMRDAGLGGSAAGPIGNKLLMKLIADAVSAATPGKVVLDGVDAKPVKLTERTHPQFEKVLRLVRAGLNVLLVGPAGCGKTTLAHQIAKALKRTYGTLHCTAGASESQVIGWLLPLGESGAFTYVPSEFVRLYEEGDSVFLFDEIDAADPNMLLIINGALANGALHVPQRHKKPHVARGKNAAIIAAANTFGTGADAMYAGRNQLDAATLDRFYVVEMGYDAALEADFVGAAAPANGAWTAATKPDADELKAIGTWVAQLRAQVAQHKLRRVASTRMIQKAVAARVAGVPLPEVKKDLLAGWTRDELIKIGGVN